MHTIRVKKWEDIFRRKGSPSMSKISDAKSPLSLWECSKHPTEDVYTATIATPTPKEFLANMEIQSRVVPDTEWQEIR